MFSKVFVFLIDNKIKINFKQEMENQELLLLELEGSYFINQC